MHRGGIAWNVDFSGLMFTPITISYAAQMELKCNNLMQSYNDGLAEMTRLFKAQWTEFWAKDNSLEDMQAQLDQLAQTAVIDQGVSTNALAAYFAKALRLITFISTENVSAFTDATADETGQCRRYLTPGWTYTVESGGRIVVFAPCSWI